MKIKYLLFLLICFQILACKKDAKETPAPVVPPSQPTQPTPGLLQQYGLGTNLIAAKSLNKSYDFYFDQFDGTKYESINCGPTVTTMALKWADSTFSKKPVDARNAIPAGGGWWYTTDIENYLNGDQINHTIVSFTDATADSVIKYSIDHRNLVILCIDMYYVAYNPTSAQHTNKFYYTNNTGWGHFLLVKGYRQVDGNMFYEIYDPNSDHQSYPDNSLKGKDRYYLNSDITAGTNVWWPYAIVLAPKGQQVSVAQSSGLTTSSLSHIPVARGQYC
jgi:hypothetical protein